MQAIILAAGMARRLASLGQEAPKCLLKFDNVTLLRRHLDNLAQLGCQRVTLVVGHRSEMIAAEVARYNGPMPIDLVTNPDFQRGSILSLRTGLTAIRGDESLLIMDADVLYHPEVLARLVRAPFDAGFLLDERSEAKGEEMMLGARAGRVWTISRRIGVDWDAMGEGVGFFKMNGSDVPVLLGEIDKRVAQGLLDSDYESAIDGFLKERPAFFAPVKDLPWTEIDFDEDVERARVTVLPALAAIASAQASAAI